MKQIFAVDWKRSRPDVVAIDQVYFYRKKLFVRFRHEDEALQSACFSTMRELKARFQDSSGELEKHVYKLLGRVKCTKSA